MSITRSRDGSSPVVLVSTTTSWSGGRGMGRAYHGRRGRRHRPRGGPLRSVAAAPGHRPSGVFDSIGGAAFDSLIAWPATTRSRRCIFRSSAGLIELSSMVYASRLANLTAWAGCIAAPGLPPARLKRGLAQKASRARQAPTNREEIPGAFKAAWPGRKRRARIRDARQPECAPAHRGAGSQGKNAIGRLLEDGVRLLGTPKGGCAPFLISLPGCRSLSGGHSWARSRLPAGPVHASPWTRRTARLSAGGTQKKGPCMLRLCAFAHGASGFAPAINGPSGGAILWVAGSRRGRRGSTQSWVSAGLPLRGRACQCSSRLQGAQVQRPSGPCPADQGKSVSRTRP